MRAPIILSALGFSLLLVTGCDTADAVDAGMDVPRIDASAEDSGGALDMGTVLDAPGGDDTAPSDASPDDTGMDAATLADAAFDGGSDNPCVSAGGACVAVVPGSCPTGIVGDPTRYSCGGGLGVLCCLPLSTPPHCEGIGTRSEGWASPDGTRICFAACAGATASCENVGTRSEGWYSDLTTAGCMTPPVERLIEWTDCSP